MRKVLTTELLKAELYLASNKRQNWSLVWNLLKRDYILGEYEHIESKVKDAYKLLQDLKEIRSVRYGGM